MQSPAAEPPIPSPDGRMEGIPFDPAEIFARPWNQAPGAVRGMAYHALWFYDLFCFLLLIAGIVAVVEDPTPDVWAIPILGLAGIIMTFWLRNGFKKHSKAAWRVQAGLWLFGLLLIPVGTIVGLVFLWMWDGRETRAWFGLKINPNRARRTRRKE